MPASVTTNTPQQQACTLLNLLTAVVQIYVPVCACTSGPAGLSGCCLLPHLLVDGKSFNVDPTICLTFPCNVTGAQCEGVIHLNRAAFTSSIWQLQTCLVDVYTGPKLDTLRCWL